MTTRKFGPKDAPSYLEKARATWKAKLPPWIEDLARAADDFAARGIGMYALERRTGVKAGHLSSLIANTFTRNIAPAERKVRAGLVSLAWAPPVANSQEQP